jgi:hypothetical protein
MVKRIKLFGLTIWEIETIDDQPLEDEEDEPISDPYTLSTHTTQPQDPPPTFGFVTEWGWGDE